MGLSTKQVSGDHQGFDWPSLQPSPPELPNPPPSAARRPLQQQTELLKCPRCSSTNTKFCYYNNYNKSQPRHFCKSCKRHWTKGGTLRNVPIGGGRKNKRLRTSNSAAQDRPSFPMSANTGNNQKSMSNILYKALIGSPLLHEKSGNINNNNNDVDDDNINIINNNGGNTSATQYRHTEFDQFSSLSTYFDMNNHFSYQSFDHHYPGNLDSIDESTVNNIPGSSSVTWPGPDTGSTLDFPNYWNWSEIDVLASSGHLNISWDDDNDNDADQEIKP